MDNGNLTVMSYQLPRNAVLGPYDVSAIQAVYGSPTGAMRLEAWSWNAATETYTASIPGDGRYMRGTAAKDVLTAMGSGVAIVTMQGDDVVNIGSGAAEVNAGSAAMWSMWGWRSARTCRCPSAGMLRSPIS